MNVYVNVAVEEFDLTGFLPFLLAALAIVVGFAAIVSRRKKGNREPD
jgi:hypothetical protein